MRSDPSARPNPVLGLVAVGDRQQALAFCVGGGPHPSQTAHSLAHHWHGTPKRCGVGLNSDYGPPPAWSPCVPQILAGVFLATAWRVWSTPAMAYLPDSHATAKYEVKGPQENDLPYFASWSAIVRGNCATSLLHAGLALLFVLSDRCYPHELNRPPTFAWTPILLA